MNVVASPALRLRKLTVADPNLDELYQVYSQPGHAYWVVEYEVKWSAAVGLRH